MTSPATTDPWDHGDPYERYIGRWSRAIAPLFLSWLDLPQGLRWVDVGCGTGALSSAIVSCSPRRLVGVEPSDGFRALAVRTLGDRVLVMSGSAAALPLDDGAVDAVVSGLVLNFVPDLPAALAEMARVVEPDGTVAAYVWDYADGMEVIKSFWDAAAALDPSAARLHEGVRFPVCNPAALADAFRDAGFVRVHTTALDLTARFVDFDDYWQPFLGGQGPAPGYAVSLSQERRDALRTTLRSMLRPSDDGSIALRARAWAVRGTKRGP